MLEIRKSDSIKNIAGKLLQIQKEQAVVTKDSKNPFFKSNYASLGAHLEVILPLCTTAELVVSQLPTGNGLTTLLVDTKSGEWIESSYPILTEGKTPQEIGSSMSYARRYSLSAIFNLATVDDDANIASGKVTSNTSTTGVPSFNPLLPKK